MTRRIRRAGVAVTAVLALPVLAGVAGADGRPARGPMRFDPIPGSADAPYACTTTPFVIPDGFTQRVVSDESDLDIYAGQSDWNDMNTANETGDHAGRYLYRTHEVRPRGDVAGYQGGALSVVDMRTGAAEVLAQRADWEALDGIVWSPWGSVLFAEETGEAEIGDPDVPAAVRGLAYELTLDEDDPTVATGVTALPMLGSVSHEGIEFDAEGNVYVIDEYSSGSIYRFVPDRYGDLSSGQLYGLVVDDGGTGTKTGAARWAPLDMAAAQVDARAAADAVGATGYGRPEDLERIGSTLYAAITSEDRVLAITLGESPVVSEFVAAGRNVPVEVDPDNGADPEDETDGFNGPDNLANGPGGRLWIVEDNEPSDVYVADRDADHDGLADGVHLFASLDVPGAEATGIYFGRDPRTLLVNIQHADCDEDGLDDDDADMTVAISRQRHGRGRD